MVSRKPGPVKFPTLYVAHDWAEWHCVIPDGFLKGEPWEFWDWQSWCILNFYRVKPTAEFGQLAPAFKYRRSQIVLPQKAGKAPYTAAHTCIEAVGPALFAGWAEGGEVWDCRDHGCGCGWIYEYEPGEAMGMSWPTPLIQITAYSEEQTDNIYDALRPMIDHGPLSDLIPKTGEEFIRLPNEGRIDIVTSSAKSRLGQRVTFVPQDETGIWTPEAGMVKVAETQRRGLSGMGGRAEETTNAWDPTDGSVAQRTAERNMKDVFRYHPEPPPHLDYKVKADRTKIHRILYADSPSVDPDAIDAEADELVGVDAHQAERFYGNRSVSGKDKAFDIVRFKELGDPETQIEADRKVVLSFDGSQAYDATGLMATDIETGFQQVVGFWERPPECGPDDDWQIDVADVHQHVDEAFNKFDVWRFGGDPPYWRSEIAEWAGIYGEERVWHWETNRRKVMCYATKSWVTDIANGSVTHDASPELVKHVGNAVKRVTKMRDGDSMDFLWYPGKEYAHSLNRIDLSVVSIIGWDLRSQALAAGVINEPDHGRAAW